MTEATRRLLEPIYMSLFAGLTEGLYVSDADPDGSRRSYALPELLQAEHCPFGKPALWRDVCCLRYNESFGVRVEESWIPFSAHATPEQLTHLRHLPLFTVQAVNSGLFLGACGWRLRFGLQSSVTLLMDGLASAPVFLTSPASSAVTKATACVVRSPIPDDGILDSTKLLDLISSHVQSAKTGNMLLVLPSLPDALHVLDILATEGPSLLPVVLAISKIDSVFASVRGLADWANEAALEVFIHSRESPLDQVLNSRSGPPIFTASDLPETRTILKTLRPVRSLVVTGPTLSGRGLPLDVFLEFFAGDSESVVITAEGEPSLPDLVLLKCSVTPIPDVKLRELFESTVDLDEGELWGVSFRRQFLLVR
ncbi:MAG: hypothetical protein KVP17_004356 [Porospora cf. gigantea B]|uniref:uncharacterized protein n=1 Tax=Porospora cf. gigantea B TaxID=2853592 RepID=UPI003571F3AA|nr:MAG: hypothetical protein KVP17_004356 [Porospora cf. gigantea B]